MWSVKANNMLGQQFDQHRTSNMLFGLQWAQTCWGSKKKKKKCWPTFIKKLINVGQHLRCWPYKNRLKLHVVRFALGTNMLASFFVLKNSKTYFLAQIIKIFEIYICVINYNAFSGNIFSCIKSIFFFKLRKCSFNVTFKNITFKKRSFDHKILWCQFILHKPSHHGYPMILGPVKFVLLFLIYKNDDLHSRHIFLFHINTEIYIIIYIYINIVNQHKPFIYLFA